jgi:uncharacterized membrane protein
MDSTHHPVPAQPRPLQLLALILAVLAVATGMRLWGLEREPVWLDEAYSVLLSEGTPSQVLQVNARDVHPPAYYLGLADWRQGFGSTPASIRGYSLAWSLLGVALVILLVAALELSWSTATLAGLLMAINPLDIYFAQEARMYTQASALGVASSWALWRWLDSRYEGGSRLAPGVWLALYVCAAALLIQTLYLGAFILLAQGCFILVSLLPRRDLRGVLAYAGAGLVTTLMAVPWLAYMLTHGPHRLGRLDWLSAPSLPYLLSPFFRQFYTGRMTAEAPGHRLLFLAAAAMSLVALSVLVLTCRRRSPTCRRALYLAWMTCVPLGLVFLASHLYRPVYSVARFPVLVLPTLLALLAFTATSLEGTWMRRSFAGLAMVIMLIASVVQYRQVTKSGLAEFAELYHRLGPPDHVVLLPPDQTITASYVLGFPLVNSNQQQIQDSLAAGRESVIWVGVRDGYLATADPGVHRVHQWLLTLGPSELLASVDHMELWQIRVPGGSGLPADD